MSENVERPWKIARLQRVVAQPITSRARQAALDKARRRQRGKTTTKPT